MVFEKEVFYSIANLSSNVPVFTCGGLAKQYLVPGWRIGWIVIKDSIPSRLMKVREGIVNLTQVIVGANTLIQAAIPKIILNTPPNFFENTMKILECNAKTCLKLLENNPVLSAVIPQGALYLMININVEKLKDILDDLDFVEKLVQEQSVLCLPGKCFNSNGNYVRVVFSSPTEKLIEAFERIKQFCKLHSK